MKEKLTKSIISAILLLNLSAQAQVSAYAFTQRLGTYVPITTGTVFGSSTSNNEFYVDPNAPLGGTITSGVGLPIGFTFTYNGTPCDVIGISTNGWIGLGQSTLTPGVHLQNFSVSDGFYVINGTSTASPTHQQRIGGLSMDLASQAGGRITMATIGTAPNRTCVVQWSNYKKVPTLSPGLGDSFEFQIRLLETSNAVEVVYGTFFNSLDLTPLNITVCQVGLRGAINTDFNSRGVYYLTPDPIPWLNSITLTLSNLVSYIADNLTPYLPVKGLTYRWLPPSPCTTPTNVTAVTPQTLACSNGSFSVEVDNYSTYTNPNTYTYQWYSSTVSAVGPFSPVTNATAAAIPVNNPSVTTWYQAGVTCGITLGTATTNAVVLQIAAGTTTSSVPYNEGFEGVMRNDDLPNCSWATTSPTNCLTYTSRIGNNNRFSNSGNKFATFRGYAPFTGEYFYSNGIQLEPGVTYSAGVRYITSGVGNWPEFSLMLGNIPAASSMSNIASVFNTSPTSYSLMSNTFTVAASGIYYLGIKCSAGSSALQFLSFDDLFVMIPCSLNTPAVSISANNYTVCSGKSTTLTAMGATSYNWGNATGSTYVVSPQASATYSVIGTSSLSGCTNSTSINIIVNPTPLAAIIAQAPSVCPGASVTLYASGNGLFSWNNGLTAPSIVVSPSVNTTYTLTVLSLQGGCVNSATRAIGVYTPAPLFAQANNGAMCLGETIQLTGSGNGIVSFEWRSNNITIHSKVASVSPLTSTTYSLIGTDGNGCTSTQTLQLLVKVCTGITENAGNSKLLVFPNPTSGRLTISTGNALIKNIVVTDVTGRLITTMSSDTEVIELNLEGLANGIYYAKITSGKENSMMKIVKD